MARLVNYKFPIPDVIDPPDRLCLLIEVPNDETHIENLFGAIQSLTQGFSWENDTAHSAKALAQVWRDVYSKIRFIDCPTPPRPLPGESIEDLEMPIRIDCDCNVFITCCDGTEKQILTSDQVQALVTGQPGSGTPQPPAGGCKQYPVKVAANGTWLNPALVNTGDTLTLSELAGATTDVAPIGRWNCPDGEAFVGGICTGTTQTDAGAFAPLLPIGIPLYAIGGNYYDARSAFTVPGGITNGICAIVVNYSPGGNYGGDITAVLTDCNNQAGAWESTLDFTAFAYVPPVTVDVGIWNAGLGYEGAVNGAVAHYAQLHIDVDSCTITSMQAYYDDDGPNGSGPALLFQTNGSAYGAGQTPTVAANQLLGIVGEVTAVTQVLTVLDTGVGGGPCRIRKWVIQGVGPKPSQLP